MEQPIRIAGTTLGADRHICAFFQSPAEEYRVLLPFIKEGYAREERGFHVVDPARQEDHLSRLKHGGVDVERAISSGRLEVKRWDDVYLQDGRFDQERMLALIGEILASGRSKGLTLTRYVAQMNWALESKPRFSDVLAYEARLNLVMPERKDPIVCVYDTAGVDTEVTINILRTHPMAIIRGVLHRNPHYLQPEEFLRELAARDTEQ